MNKRQRNKAILIIKQLNRILDNSVELDKDSIGATDYCLEIIQDRIDDMISFTEDDE